MNPHITQITTEAEFDTLLPIQNHLDDNASLDGRMFETFGAELEFVKAQDSNLIWTYVEGDNGNLHFTSGYHFVNRLGYLVTTIPYLGPEASILVCEFDDDEMEAEMQDEDETGHS